MLSIWDSKGVFFCKRHKENLKFETLQERELPPKGAQNILKDEEIVNSQILYPKKISKKIKKSGGLGRMKNKKPLKFHNNFFLSSFHHSRIIQTKMAIFFEIFFRDIKQLLHQNIYRNI